MPIRAEGLNHAEVLQRLTDHIRARGHGGQKKVAEEFGISEQLLCDILKKRKQIINLNILESLGLQATIVYERVTP